MLQHPAPQLHGQTGLARAQTGLLPGLDQRFGLAGCLKRLGLPGLLQLFTPAGRSFVTWQASTLMSLSVVMHAAGPDLRQTCLAA